MTGSPDAAQLDAVIADLTVDAYGDDEQLAGFLTAAEQALHAPQPATVVGVPVQVTEISAGPDGRRGIVAICARGTSTYETSFADVAFQPGTELAQLVAAYRRWLGCEP